MTSLRHDHAGMSEAAPRGRGGLIAMDVGEVLLEIDAAACPRHLAALLGLDPEVVSGLLYGSGLYDQWDTGLLDEAAFADALREVLHAPGLSIEAMRQAWSAAFGDVDALLVPLAADLSQRGRLLLASNNNAWHWPECRSRLTAAGLRKDTPAVLSYEIGRRKPEAEFYQRMLELAPSDVVLFVDDRIENVAAAEAAGIPGCHHTDSRATAARLTQFTRIPDEEPQ